MKEKQITDAVNLALRTCSDNTELGVSLLFQINALHELSCDEEYFAFYQMYDYLDHLGGHDAYRTNFNWGTALSRQAVVKTGDEADKLFILSYEKFEKALAVKPDYDSAFYNQACWWAIHKKVDHAVDKLKLMKPLDSKLANDIKKDPDFAGIINHPDFKAFLDSLAP